ncbi:hypothetical protein ACFLYL_02210 [Chloroflexota bacterium]
MVYIWSSEALEALFEHTSENIRNWAVSRFFDLYPDMFERIIGLLPTATEGIASRILHRLLDLNIQIQKPGTLVEVLQGTASWDIKALSAALLLRCGYNLLPSEMESIRLTEYASVLASTEQGFDVLLQLYRENSQDTKSVLKGIAEACGFTHLFNNMLEKKNKNEIRKAREYFSRLWSYDIPAIERISVPQEILSTIERTTIEAVSQNETTWKRGLLAELEYETARLARVREIAGERALKWSDEETRFMLAFILCLQRNEACWSYLVKADDAAGLWKALVMKPWRGVPGQSLRDFLLSPKPDELLDSLSSVLCQEYSYASYAFSILNALDTPGRFELYLDFFEGKRYTDILAEEAGDALRGAGIPAIEFIMEHYPQMSEGLRTLVLFVLDSFPTTQVVDFCLKHFDEYMRGSDPEEFVGCLEEIASSHFLPPLLGEWREGEVGIGKAIKLISEVNNIRDEQIDSIIQDTEKRARHPEDAMDKPISSFPLRCANCGHTYKYEINNIYVDKGGSPVIGDIIQCKGCGSIETYEMTAHTQFGFTAELLRAVALKQEQGEEASDSIN